MYTPSSCWCKLLELKPSLATADAGNSVSKGLFGGSSPKTYNIDKHEQNSLQTQHSLCELSKVLSWCEIVIRWGRWSVVRFKFGMHVGRVGEVKPSSRWPCPHNSLAFNQPSEAIAPGPWPVETLKCFPVEELKAGCVGVLMSLSVVA